MRRCHSTYWGGSASASVFQQCTSECCEERKETEEGSDVEEEQAGYIDASETILSSKHEGIKAGCKSSNVPPRVGVPRK
jgi:hypothetical protein